MNLATDDWRALSRLLDEALALPEAQRVTWAATLGDEHQVLKPLLVDLFGRPASARTADFFATLPAFAPMPPLDEPLAGTLVGPYRIIRAIGRGGMGAVWLAQRDDGLVRRQVALKLPMLAGSRQALSERFSREREILSQLCHPNIAQLCDAGFADEGRPFLALEYVAGQPIGEHCDRLRLPVPRRIQLVLQVLAAVQHAHTNLILHRDLKPSNILVTAEGDVKLLDFGIAKLMTDGAASATLLTQIGGIAVTTYYASPEQIVGAPLNTASDVYSLGVVLYELLAGASPYRLQRRSRGEIEEAILRQDPVPPSAAVRAAAAAQRSASASRLRKQLAGDLDAIVLKALSKRATERYATAEALAQDLQRHLSGSPVHARPAGRWYRMRKFAVRNRLPLAAASGIAAALLAGTTIALWQAHVAQFESTRARASKTFIDHVFATVARNNPAGAAAADTTARQILDTGSRQLLEQSSPDPQLQLELLEWFAHLDTELDVLDRASTLADEAVALASRLHGARSLPVAEALGQKADTLYRAGDYVQAQDIAGRALDVAAETPRATVELRARMHIIISNAAFQLDATKTAEPQRHLEIALALLRESHSTSEERSRAAYYLAWIKEAQSDFAAAEAHYADGIATARANFGERSFMVAFGYENLADLLRKQHRLAEARETIGKALEIYGFVLGPRHGTVAFARTTLALIEAESGDYATAEREADDALALAAELFGATARQTGYPAIFAARIKAQRGELDAAARAFEQAVAVIARTEPATSLTARILRVELAATLIASGRLDQAGAALDEADRGFAAAHDDTSIYAARASIARAALLHARGDEVACRMQLEHALAQVEHLQEPVGQILPRFAEVAANVDLPREAVLAVLARLDRAGLLTPPDQLPMALADKAVLATAVGRLYLRAGDRASAARWLERAVALRAVVEVRESPFLANARASLAVASSVTDP